MWNFVPDKQDDPFQVPYFEDARSDYAPYYSSRQNESEAKAAVAVELGKLGASGVTFQSGHFLTGKIKRYGYNIRFYYRQSQSLIRVAGLPMRSETAVRLDQVRVQALLNVRDWFKAAVTSRIFAPGSDVLIPFMLVDPEAGVTVGELMSDFIETGRIPQLPARSQSEDYEEGEFTET